MDLTQFFCDVDDFCQLKFMSDRYLPGALRSDQQKIRQILTNLLSNAIKFTGKGRIDIYYQRFTEKHR